MLRLLNVLISAYQCWLPCVTSLIVAGLCKSNFSINRLGFVFRNEKVEAFGNNVFIYLL